MTMMIIMRRRRRKPMRDKINFRNKASPGMRALGWTFFEFMIFILAKRDTRLLKLVGSHFIANKICMNKQQQILTE